MAERPPLDSFFDKGSARPPLESFVQQDQGTGNITDSGPYKALDVGLQEGVAGVGAIPGAVANLGAKGIQGATNYVMNKLGLPDDTRDVTKPGLAPLPTYNSLLTEIQKNWGGRPYTPQNPLEEGLRTVGQFAPNVVLPGGVMRNVVAPALGSEALGQATKGTEAEPYARLAGAVGGAGIANKVGNAFGRTGAYRGAPTLAEQGDIVDQGYNAARASGVELDPAYVARGLGQIQRDLTTGVNARDPTLIDKTLGVLKGEHSRTAMSAITNPGAGTDFTRLDAMRRNLGEIARSKSPDMLTEAASARIAQAGIDGMLESAAATPGAVLKGDAAELARLATTARGNAAAEFRMRAMDAVRTRAADSATGESVQGLRTQMRSFIRPNNAGVSPASKAGLNPAEIADIRQATRFGVPQLLEWAGKGGQLGTMGLIGGAIYSHDPHLEALALARLGARGTANAIMRSRMGGLERMIGARSPEAVSRGILPVPPKMTITRSGLLGSAAAVPTLPGLLERQ